MSFLVTFSHCISFLLSIFLRLFSLETGIIVEIEYQDKFVSSGDAGSYQLKEMVGDITDYPADENNRTFGILVILIVTWCHHIYIYIHLMHAFVSME